MMSAAAASVMPAKLSMRTDDPNTMDREITVLQNLSLIVVLDHDPRPTFVVDTRNLTDLHIAYRNPALANNKNLCSSLQNACSRDVDFSAWVAAVNGQDKYHRHAGALWFGFLVDNRWKVISTTSSTSFTGFSQSHNKLPGNGLVNQGLIGQSGMSGSQHATYQATINQLEEEIRNLEFAKKLAEREKSTYRQALHRLRNQTQTVIGDGVSQPMSRTTSYDSVDRPNGTGSNSKRPDIHRLLSQPIMSTGMSVSELLPDLKDIAQPTMRLESLLPLPLKSDDNSESILALEKFRRLIEMVDVGFFDFDPTGRLVHANESWYVMSGHPREPEAHTTLTFQQCVYHEDAEVVQKNWQLLLEGHAVTFEMRWKKPGKASADPIQASDIQWVLAACVPVVEDDGQIKSIIGCTTDINFQKHTAAVAMQRAEALERARASEERFARFASAAPIAIFRFDKHRNVEYCNDRWFELTGVPKSRFEDITFPFGVADEDVGMCSAAWDTAIAKRSICTAEFRLNKEWHDVHSRRGPTWVHATFFPEFGEDGSYQGLMGSLSNISHLKWAENVQKLRAEEALEAKRQQENFIDITSHEMRNPLSAMVQCADSILSSLNDLVLMVDQCWQHRSAEENAQLHDQINISLDAAQTILSCAAHQKRIVDDILTLSKLDSNLLLITPIKTQPVQMVREAIKMFELDVRKADLALTLDLDPSFEALGVDWLTLDPSRVLQILINLVTNAIKFTRDEQVRDIKVNLSVHEEPPSKHESAIQYVPAETITDDYGSGGEWGEGAPIFLKIEVQDTGRGLSFEEKAKLFIRFSQASPKTHVQYGGSGLGLFISRKLTEMQGGEIGFASESQVGSTFAFYVKTRRTTAPPQEESVFVHHLARTAGGMIGPEKERSPLKILLVEDNIVNQRVLQQQLVRLGCTVYPAGHGVEALDFLRTTDLWHDPTAANTPSMTNEEISLDLVLMDIEMPVMGGLECTRAIRNLEQQGTLKRHLPIISISANARQEQVGEARQAGVDDTITKPFRIVDLMPKIEMLVR